MKRINFEQKVVALRMTDVEYIEHLERQILDMDTRLEEFVQKMDEAVFSRDIISVDETYAKEIKTLHF